MTAPTRSLVQHRYAPDRSAGDGMDVVPGHDVFLGRPVSLLYLEHMDDRESRVTLRLRVRAAAGGLGLADIAEDGDRPVLVLTAGADTARVVQLVAALHGGVPTTAPPQHRRSAVSVVPSSGTCLDVRASQRRPRRPLAHGLVALAVAAAAVVGAASLRVRSSDEGDEYARGRSTQPGSAGAAAAVRAPAKTLGALARQLTAADMEDVGPRAMELHGMLAAVSAMPAGERRRQQALKAVTLVDTAGAVATRWRTATRDALAPALSLATPADVIRDLGPDPAAAGPNAFHILNCMHYFAGRSAAQQQAEAREIIAGLPAWQSDGGIRDDIAAAALAIAEPVSAGRKVWKGPDAGTRSAGRARA